MDKVMYELAVRTEDGLIVIEGRKPGGDLEDYSAVALTAAQADVLIGWLREAKEELGS